MNLDSEQTRAPPASPHARGQPLDAGARAGSPWAAALSRYRRAGEPHGARGSLLSIPARP